MSVPRPTPASIATEHGLLVPFGRFADEIGLLDQLNQVPFAMKTVDHSPGEKLTELLVHILAGGMHINELETSPHPMVRDTAVAQSWGQAAFASASGVSDLLRAASSETVEGLKTAVRTVLAPYRRRILRDLTPAQWVVDFDLTGLVVSDQAKSYEDATFGYMGELGGLGRGYQFARAQLVGPRDPLLLGGFLHPGRTVSLHCLDELVTLVEAELGRPRRRVEVVERRLVETETALAATEAAVNSVAQGRIVSARQLKRLEDQRVRQQAEVARLRARRDELVADNAANPNPRRILLRVDGGFGDADRLAELYEQGYDFVARPYSHRVGASLRQEAGLMWHKVSKNGFIAETSRTTLGSCPYPLRVFACRQWWGDDRPERWSALVVNPELACADWSARRVGVFYNQRQVAEASIKEGKGTFASRHLPTRHAAGIAVYQELVLLAQNLTRWFRRQVLARTAVSESGVKELVRIGAHSRALLIRSGERVLGVQFAADGPWRGLTVLSARISYQLWFPFLEESRFVRAGP